MELDKKKLLLNNIKSGNEEAFRAFFKAEFNNLAFFIVKYIKDYEQARDIAQESFISFWNNREQLNIENNVRAYLFTIAKNKTLNYLKSYTHKVEKKGFSLSEREKQINIASLQYESVIEIIEGVELENLINKTYLNLPDRVKEIFILNREMGFTYEEIANKKKISVKVVEYQISLALKAFKKRLKGFMLIIF